MTIGTLLLILVVLWAIGGGGWLYTREDRNQNTQNLFFVILVVLLVFWLLGGHVWRL